MVLAAHTLLDNDQIEDRDVLGDDAATHGLSAALSGSSAIPTEALVAWRHE